MQIAIDTPAKVRVVRAMLAADSEAKSHCIGDFCQLAGPRAVYGICACNCPRCRRADGVDSYVADTYAHMDRMCVLWWVRQ